jgi:purine nucleoside phosphorylase
LTPLRGAADDELGALFPDLANLYDRRLLALAAAAARSVKIPFATGILAATSGPHLETAAERAFFRQAGAHVVGQSIVVPSLAAAHAGLRVLALGVVVEPLRSRHEYADPGLLARNAAAASRACAALLSSWIPAVDVE